MSDDIYIGLYVATIVAVCLCGYFYIKRNNQKEEVNPLHALVPVELTGEGRDDRSLGKSTSSMRQKIINELMGSGCGELDAEWFLSSVCSGTWVTSEDINDMNFCMAYSQDGIVGMPDEEFDTVIRILLYLREKTKATIVFSDKSTANTYRDITNLLYANYGECVIKDSSKNKLWMVTCHVRNPLDSIVGDDLLYDIPYIKALHVEVPEEGAIEYGKYFAAQEDGSLEKVIVPVLFLDFGLGDETTFAPIEEFEFCIVQKDDKYWLAQFADKGDFYVGIIDKNPEAETYYPFPLDKPIHVLSDKEVLDGYLNHTEEMLEKIKRAHEMGTLIAIQAIDDQESIMFVERIGWELLFRNGNKRLEPIAIDCKNSSIPLLDCRIVEDWSNVETGLVSRWLHGRDENLN